MTARPFADAALDLHRAGWCPLPLPAGAKHPPRTGTTGAAGVDLSMADLVTLAEDHPDANVATRAPEGVLGIDVDHYDSKHGGDTLAELAADLGPLPPTWTTTSRDDGVSGIRWYQVPPSRLWTDLDCIEAIQRTHRYAVMPPSQHPDGRTYRWLAPDGTTSDGPPEVDTLPDLPAAWVQRLSRDGTRTPVDPAGDDETRQWVQDFRRGDACRPVADVIAAHATEVTGGAHPSTMAAARELVWLGSTGHAGAYDGLRAVRDLFHAEVTRRGGTRRADGHEWRSIVRYAVGSAQAHVDQVADVCTCVTTIDVPAENDPVSAEDGPTSGDVLEFLTLRELAAKVDAAGPRSWLLRRVWPQGDYGVHAAEEKGQKSWNAFDMAVSVASGTPWLGHVPVDTVGPVVLFVGEGGEANTVRRLQGIADERGLPDVLDLPIHICARAPHLDDKRHIVELARKVRDVQPALVVVDPLYLAARGAELGNLYSMGAMLEGVQHICQKHGASLLLVHHANRTGRTGSRSISGAGPAEWGRVLITAEVKAKRTDPDTMETDTTTVLSVIGGEVADQTIRVRRRIRKADPDDLDSPFVIVTEAGPADTKPTGSSDPEDNLPPAAQKLLEAARTDPDRDWTGSALVDLVAAEHGHGLKRETVSRSLNDMERMGLFTSEAQGPFEETIWRLAPRVTSRDQNGDHATKSAESSRDSRDVTRDGHTAEAPVTRVTSSRREVTQSRDSDHTTATCDECGTRPPMPYPPARYAGLCLPCADAAQEASA